MSGIFTYAFQSLCARVLGAADYGSLMLLWTATFLAAQVLWLGATQTLGRHIAEREAKGEDTKPVVRTVRLWQFGVLAVFVAVCLPLVPLLTDFVFGEVWLAVAFILAVAAYAPEFFRRGLFNGYRQPKRFGAQILTETTSRVVFAVALLSAGAGLFGAAAAIVLAPVVGALVVRPKVSPRNDDASPPVATPFRFVEAFGFALPVLLCVALAQTLMNGGPILLALLGGTPAEVGVFGAAMLLTRIPQYVLSPVIGALLPHASRTLTNEGAPGLDRLALRTVFVLSAVGVAMVLGAWLMGGFALRLFAGTDFTASRMLLVTLAALAALYLISDALNQMLFALGSGRLAALGWLIGTLIVAVSLVTLDPLPAAERVSVSLALGALAATLSEAAFYLKVRDSRVP